MLFNSYIFILLFLPITLIVYYMLNHLEKSNLSLFLIVLASFIFYAYNNVKYVFVLGVSILLNWFICFLLRKSKRKSLLVVGILLNVGSIFYFKYYNFFIENFNKLLSADFQLRNIVLPLGISFFTFQQISFLIDSYRGETRDYTFVEYAAFVSFFPQLVAGPIVLHNEIIPQFRDEAKRKFNHESFAYGIYAFSAGLFKKVLVADTFGKAVSWGWENIDAMTSLEIIIVMVSYTFQIYFDFSGYCDMAIGIGKMFNIDLPVNFDSPYKSYSILEFWKRWHMTLTRFLRNYIYFPLGGSRKGKIRTYINIMIVFLVSGIWHGANWTFVLWGMLHGIAQVLNRIFQKSWGKCNQVVRWIATFVFVNLMWLLFRAESIGQAVYLFKRMIIMDSFSISDRLMSCFRLKEMELLLRLVKPLSLLSEKINGFYMWGALGGALFVCLNFSNLYEKKFVPNIPKAVLTSVLLVWSIVSLGGISTFLYFNF